MPVSSCSSNDDGGSKLGRRVETRRRDLKPGWAGVLVCTARSINGRRSRASVRRRRALFEDGYQGEFAILAIPAVLAMMVLFAARHFYPRPRDLDVAPPI